MPLKTLSPIGLKKKSNVPAKYLKILNYLKQNFHNLGKHLQMMGYRVSQRWLTLRAEQLFNLNVGIERVVNLKYDTQLQKAISIIKAKEVGRTIHVISKPLIIR